MKDVIRHDKGQVPWTAPAILVSCTGVSVLSTDLYVPSLPHLPKLLNTDATTVQLTMSINLIAYAIAQLAHGPLADRYGRRQLLMVALCGFIIASLGCAFASSIGGLLAGRFAQGLFSSVPSVVVVLMIRELYLGNRAVGVMAIHGTAVGLIPAIGPLIGGYVFLAAGWRMNFILLALIASLVLALVIRLLPETGVREALALNPRRIISSYRRLLTHREYLIYMIPLSAVFGGFFAFITAGPFILIDLFKVPTQHYGLAYAALISCYITGSLTANRLAARLAADRLVQGAIGCALAGGLILLFSVFPREPDLVSVLVGMGIFCFALGLMLASGPICLLDSADDDNQGPASALLGAFQLGTASVATLAVGIFYDGTAVPMACIILFLSVVSAVGYAGLKRSARTSA